MTAAVDVETRVCARPSCGAVMMRRDTERSDHWRRRSYCTLSCGRSDRGRMAAARIPESAQPRTCALPGCDGVLQRRVGENTAGWLARQYHTKACYQRRSIVSAEGRRVLGRRLCGFPGCGLEMTRTASESPAEWARRRFCDVSCRRRGAGRPRPPAVPVLVQEPAEWEEAAACRGRSDNFWVDSSDRAEVDRVRRLAERFCVGCPARAECRVKGEQVQYGMFAGTLWRTVRGDLQRIDLLPPAVPVRAAS